MIDAKFKVVSPKRGWRLSFDWRNFLMVSGLTALFALKLLVVGH